VLLSVLIGKLLKPLLPHVGIHNPTLVWVIAPIEAFALVLVLFKVAGFVVHRKVNVYYKHKAGDLRLALWTRLNSRLGACVGLLNGAAYLVLVCFVIYNFSYWTVQVAPSDSETNTTRFINRLGHDLEDTGMAKVAHATAPLPGNFYKVADLVGLIRQNPGLSDRLDHYPAFLSLYERDDLQQLAHNNDFTSAPLGQVLNEPAVKNILQDKDLINTVWGLLQTNMDDLTNYLNTGKSPKYDSEKILGRWDFNVGVSLAMLRQTQPNIPSNEMRALRARWSQAFADTTFVAGGDDQAFLKNLPNFKNRPPTPETWKGQWEGSDTNYNLSLDNNGQSKSMTAQTDGTRLTLKDDKNVLVFGREE
jgi:hypothetical protein